MAAGAARAQVPNTLTTYEVDGVTQTARPIAFNRVFRQGEIAQFPQPKVNGTLVTGSNWQADVKDRWPDGSVKIADIALIANLPAAGNITVSFQNSSSGNNTGYITTSSSPSFATFNGGNWDGQIKVCPAGGGSCVITSAKTMLAASDPGTNPFDNCLNTYWKQGPVVTGVIIQDCTAAMSFDFGWPWNAATMGALTSGSAPTASFHPMFYCEFYPTLNSVQCEEIIENPWTSKNQDQLADLSFYTDDAGGTLQQRWSRSGARVVTGVNVTTTINFLPVVSTATLTAPTPTFVSTDVGLATCITTASYTNPICGPIQSVSSSTVAVMELWTNISSFTYTNANLYLNLQSAQSRHRKTFWSGNAPGHIRIDYNFPYLISTGALPNYDLVNASINPHNGYYPNGKCCDYGYDGGGNSSAGWTSTDRGEIGGFSGITGSYSGVLEGAPLQRADLALMYNLGTCGTSNGYCAVALQQLSGVSALGDLNSHAGLDTSTVTQFDVPGGGGMWDVLGSVPFHLRESRTTPTSSGRNGLNGGSANCFYVSQMENKNATTGTLVTDATFPACLGGGDGNVADPTGPNNATGKNFSVHTHSDNGAFPAVNVGSALNPPYSWDLGEAAYHWLDYAYLPYLLNGSPYYLETEYQSAAFQAYYSSLSGEAINVTNTGYIYRWYAWAMQTFSRAAFIAPDGSPEQAYFKTMFNSALEFVEGALGVTGTTLTPSSSQGGFATTGTINNYNWLAANRWDFGRYTGITGNTVGCLTTGSGSCPIVPSGLHQWTQGFCNNASGGGPFATQNPSTSSADVQYWMYWYIVTVLGEARDMGFSQAASVHNATEQFLEGMILSPTGNPWYALASYETQVTTGNQSTCTLGAGASLPFFTRYGGSTGLYGGWATAYGNPTSPTQQGNFGNAPPAGGLGTGNFPCADHGYSLLARAAASYLPKYGVNETDADGTYTPALAWNFANTQIPFFGNPPAAALSTDCPISNTYDVTIKWALAPPGTTPNTSVVTVASTNPPSGVNVTASPADNNSVSSGSTSFTLTYNNGTTVNLTAPSTAGGNNFVNWSGCDSSSGTLCAIAPNSNRTITANYTTPPATATLTIASTNPASGVVIAASPSDNNGHANATTLGSLLYNVGASVTLTAPATAGGNNFANWTGCTSTSGLVCTVNVSTNATITANYTTTPATAVLTVNSFNPASGVVIANSPADNSSATSVTTPGSLTFNINTAVTLTAPATSGANTFSSWSGCDLTSGTQCNVTMTANRTVTANYASPPPTVTITLHSSNPGSGVTITASPADNNGRTTCATSCAFVYNSGAGLTLTAPGTVNSNTFSSWSGCPSPSSNVCTIASATSTTITANYASPPTVNLTVASQNPASGVVVAVSPADNNGHSSATTPQVLNYNANTTVTLTAPSPAGGNNFSNWTGCDSATSNVCTIAPASSATVTAIYTTPPTPSTITVNSTGASSVVMAAQPADLANKTGGTTSFTLSYNNGTSIQIVAPATSGGLIFRSWTGCTTTAGATCNLTVNGNATVTANYSATPPAPTGLTVSGWIAAAMAVRSATGDVGAIRQ